MLNKWKKEGNRDNETSCQRRGSQTVASKKKEMEKAKVEAECKRLEELKMEQERKKQKEIELANQRKQHEEKLKNQLRSYKLCHMLACFCAVNCISFSEVSNLLFLLYLSGWGYHDDNMNFQYSFPSVQ